MIHKTLVVGPLQCNCAILACEKTKEAIVIDPGDEAERILQAVREAQFDVRYLLHTHAHFDHVGGTRGVRASIDATVCLHKGDAELYRNLPLQGRMFGIPMQEAPAVEKFIEDNEVLTFGECKLEVIHTPGHSPGGVCFRVRGGSDEKVFSGDTLFQSSVGRSDLWGGDHDQLIRSIRNRLLTLDDDLPVYPGHGPSTRVGIEKRANPFLI